MITLLLTAHIMVVIYDAILEKAKADLSIEHCGVLVNGEVIELPNSHQEPKENFLIKAEDIKPFIKKPFLIWHTHTEEDFPELTESDIRLAKRWNKPVLMVQHKTGIQDFYSPSKQSDYCGRVWKHYHQNCYTLVQDFYKRELGIRLPDYYLDHPHQYKQADRTKFQKYLPKHGFREVNGLVPFKVGDIILTCEYHSRVPWHCSVVVKTVPAVFCLSQWIHRPSGYFAYRCIKDRVHSRWRHVSEC